MKKWLILIDAGDVESIKNDYLDKAAEKIEALLK